MGYEDNKKLFDRRGFFSISNTLIRTRPADVAQALNGCLVLEAARLWEDDCTRYRALNECFDIVEKGFKAPTYELIVQRLDDGSFNGVEWKRL